VGNVSEAVSFTTSFDNQNILIMVRASAPPGIGLVGFGPFTMTLMVTATSASSSVAGTASAVAPVKADNRETLEWESSSTSVLATTTTSEGSKEFRFGGYQAKSTEPVVIWSDKAGDAVDASGHVTAGFTMSLEAGAAGGDDQFSWQVSDSAGKSMGALWVDTASGGIRLVEPNGTVHAAPQRMTPGAGAHYFVIDVDGESSSWTVSMDGVTLTKPVPLDKGGSYGEIFGVWDLGADATASGASIIFKDFRISGSR
jgi:hypothetical protein